MILDKDMLFADNLEYNGESTTLDLGTAKPGPGEPIRIFVSGTPALAGATGFTVTHGAESSSLATLTTVTASLQGNTVELSLPSNTMRYIKLALTGSPSAGNWTAGVVLPGVQTNK